MLLYSINQSLLDFKTKFFDDVSSDICRVGSLYLSILVLSCPVEYLLPNTDAPC
jgi:hypothetical protein